MKVNDFILYHLSNSESTKAGKIASFETIDNELFINVRDEHDKRIIDRIPFENIIQKTTN